MANKEVKKKSISAENFFGGNQICPHLHFRGKTVKRNKITRKQHLNILATPKGYRKVFPKCCKPCHDDESSISQQSTTCDVGDCYCKRKSCKGGGKTKRVNARRSKKKCCEPQTQEQSLKPCSERRPYFYTFVNDLWTNLTPDIIDVLKDMLVKEFGMKEREAEEFILDQRLRSILTSAGGVNQRRLPCFPYPPANPPPNDFPCPVFSDMLGSCNNNTIMNSPDCLSCLPTEFLKCLPPEILETLPPELFQKLLCISYPPCPPSTCPPPSCIPLCIPPPCHTKKKSRNCKKKKSRQKNMYEGQFNIFWDCETTKAIVGKLSDYAEMMLTCRRTERAKCIAEKILKQLVEITGEECTLCIPNNTAQRCMVFLADRLSIWLDSLPFNLDSQAQEVADMYKECEKFDRKPPVGPKKTQKEKKKRKT